MQSNIQASLENYFASRKEKVADLYYESIKDGLSNYTYKVKAQSSDLFLKVFGKLKETDVIDRKFEAFLINLCAKDGRCAKLLDSDNATFRIDEFWSGLTHPSQSDLFSEDFLNKLLPEIIAFELTLHKNKEDFSKFEHISIKSFLARAAKAAAAKFEKFNADFENFNSAKGLSGAGGAFNPENLAEIKYYLDNFDTIFDKLYSSLGSDFILSHNDIYKNNIVYHDNKLKLIDYEYSTLNFIGADIINYCIESFFDLSYSQYPYYKKIGDINDLFNDKKYFDLYIKYLDLLSKDSKLIEFKDAWRQKEYFTEVAGIMSLYWFYVAILFLDFDSNINKTGFNYVDYSIDRLAVFKKC